MKPLELVKKYPPQFLIWNLNENTGIFWVNLETLEESGFLDPWAKKFNFDDGRAMRNNVNEITEWHFRTDIQGYPVDLIVVNE
jgi:hypothetical protein